MRTAVSCAGAGPPCVCTSSASMKHHRRRRCCSEELCAAVRLVKSLHTIFYAREYVSNIELWQYYIPYIFSWSCFLFLSLGRELFFKSLFTTPVLMFKLCTVPVLVMQPVCTMLICRSYETETIHVDTYWNKLSKNYPFCLYWYRVALFLIVVIVASEFKVSVVEPEPEPLGPQLFALTEPEP